jgi:hypothetical protein
MQVNNESTFSSIYKQIVTRFGDGIIGLSRELGTTIIRDISELGFYFIPYQLINDSYPKYPIGSSVIGGAIGDAFCREIPYQTSQL